MPVVGGKIYSYTEKGIKKAVEAAKKVGKKIVRKKK